MKIIDRYILKEHTGPLVFALTTLTSLLLLNYIAKRFGQLVGKGLPWSVIGEFFMLSLPFTVAMTLPMAVLVATLYAFSRLSSENEVTAFKASGVSMRRLMAPVVLASVVLSFGMLLFNDQALPWANHRLSLLQSDIARKKPSIAFDEQIINEVLPGRIYLRFSRMEGETMRDVVIYNLSAPEKRQTIYADSGRMVLTEDQRDMQLTLYDGYIQEVSRADPLALQRLYFIENRATVRGVGNTLERSAEGGVRSDREMTVCEMQAERTKAAAQYARAYRRLERLAEAGRKVGDTIQVPRRRITGGGGLGDAYCAAQRAVLARLQPEAPADSVATATPAPPSDSTIPGADAARRIAVPVLPEERRAGPRPATADTAAEPPVTIAPSAGGLEGQSEAARLEAERQRQLFNSYDVEIHKKFALAAAIVVFVLLGPPIALRFPRGGVGLVIGVSLGVFALYYVCLIAGETVADKGYVPAPVAMWTANFAFTAAAVVLLARIGREASTGRGGDWGELKEAARQRAAALLRRVGIRAERRQVA